MVGPSGFNGLRRPAVGNHTLSGLQDKRPPWLVLPSDIRPAGAALAGFSSPAGKCAATVRRIPLTPSHPT
jgi:hypothetical protein